MALDLIDSLDKGIVIPSDLHKVYSEVVPSNHRSALEAHVLVTQKLSKEIMLNRVVGPFEIRPPNLHISPLAAVPKRESDSVRLIHDLSYPHGASVNDFIDRQFCTVVYELLDTCLDIIYRLAPKSKIAKADYAEAYRSLSVSAFDMQFLGFTWGGLFFFDTRLPMGCGISCSRFEKFASAVHWILKNKFQVKFISHILDDFMFLVHQIQTTAFEHFKVFNCYHRV
ncbi:MAG: hypothetical protein GY705_28610 [Bacteroidetes bacterium]|nr:hypothetical protein [Bacteroidota bacterium]